MRAAMDCIHADSTSPDSENRVACRRDRVSRSRRPSSLLLSGARSQGPSFFTHIIALQGKPRLYGHNLFTAVIFLADNPVFRSSLSRLALCPYRSKDGHILLGVILPGCGYPVFSYKCYIPVVITP